MSRDSGEGRGRSADSSLSREPDVGPDLRTPRIVTQAESKHLTTGPPKHPWDQLI